MINKHTAGPWHLYGNEIQSKDGALICEMRPHKYAFNDAVLIAAAPELLEAIIYAFETLDISTAHKRDQDKALALLSFAIAKATGQ